MSIEYKFDELRLIPNPAKPTEALGYIDGLADISDDPMDRERYIVTDLWCMNTAEDGTSRLVLIDRKSPLFDLLANSLHQQFGESILERLDEEAAYA